MAAAFAAAAACGTPSEFGKEATFARPARGALATEHPLATEAGLAVLDRGGNAADAAVAAALVLAVVHPQAGNLGGGGFALWVAHDGHARAFDFRESAPAAARPEAYFDAAGKPVAARLVRGPLSVAVPGTPAGLERIALELGSGKLTLTELAAPAVQLARKGAPVDAWLAHDLAQSGAREKFNAAGRALFFPDGRPLREGATLVQPDLARTLERFGREGARAVYGGETGAALCAAIASEPIPERERGGPLADASAWITPQDLASYRAVEREPLSGWFRGRQIVTIGPPSSGGVLLLQTLGVLEGLPLDPERDAGRALARFEPERAAHGSDPGLTERMLHWWIEALRGAFADRAQHLGDPDGMLVSASSLLAPQAIAERRLEIGDVARPDLRPYAAAAPREGGETTHVSVLDAHGNALSITVTLNTRFGSGILAGGAGFLLNDEMDDFAVATGVPNVYGLVGTTPNAVVPGRRPLSSMTPAVVRDGGHANVLVIGSPGGPRIPTAVAQVLLRWIVFEEPLDRALAAPRLHQQWRPAATELEPNFPEALAGALEQRFRQPLVRTQESFGAVQAVGLATIGGAPIAVSDPRRGGSAAVQDGVPSRPARPGAWRAAQPAP